MYAYCTFICILCAYLNGNGNGNKGETTVVYLSVRSYEA